MDRIALVTGAGSGIGRSTAIRLSQAGLRVVLASRSADALAATAAACPGPEIRVMPMVGSWELLHWPPFTASPLHDGRLWEYVEWGEITDVGALMARGPGRAFWVPAPDRRSARHGCVVIKDNLVADEYWLPAGVYADRWAPRADSTPLTASQLLALPGVTDLSRSSERRQLLGV